MRNVQTSINSIAKGLYDNEIINKTTLRDITDESYPNLYEYTGSEIQDIREREQVSQAVFAKYLNISSAMVRGLEQGQRKAQGAILKLINIVDKNGLNFLA